MPRPHTAEDRAQAQAKYLHAIYEEAKQVYEKNKTTLPIDPQGRVLLQVRLSAEAWKKLCGDLSKEAYTKLLGHPVTETTTVSYDLQTGQTEKLDLRLLDALQQHIKIVLSGKKADTDLSSKKKQEIEQSTDAIIKRYEGLAKERIIGLQQETHFHAHLIGRMLEEAIRKENPNQDKNTEFQKGLDNALLLLNEKVLALQAKALVIAHNKSPRNEEEFQRYLNKALDEARKALLPEIAKTIRVEVIKATHIQFDKNIVKHLTKELAKATNASLNDTVHISKGMGAISYLGATANTSHKQRLGGEGTADQMMYSHHLSEKGNVEALTRRQQVRVPALALKVFHKITGKLLDQERKNPALANGDLYVRIKAIAEGKSGLSNNKKLSKEEIAQIKDEYRLMKAKMQQDATLSRKEAFDAVIIEDTAAKIKALQEKYSLGGEDRGIPESKFVLVPKMPNAFVYNLYTSINRTGEAATLVPHPAEAIDENNNKQTQSLVHILRGAHEYNRKNKDKPLCLVQNIPVNGWGHTIELRDDNPDIVNEAALMTYLATLHTIRDTFSEGYISEVRELFQEYTNFLDGPDNGLSFYDYLKRNRLLGLVEKVKTAVKKDMNYFVSIATDKKPFQERFVNNAKHALAYLAFEKNAFSHHQHGFTYQALSVFVEKASISGCKSANERTQAVNGRVAILDFISLGKEQRNALLSKYLSPAKTAELSSAADKLQNALWLGNINAITNNLNTLYGSLNLEGFQTLVSLIDQGGHAKLSTKGKLLDTNSADPVHTNVEYASSWQCHKNLLEHVQAEFLGIRKIHWKKEIGNTLKAVAAAIGVTGVAIGVAGAVGLMVGFPPIGLIVAAAAASALIAYTLLKIVPKLWLSSKIATETRFEAIKEDNRELREEQPSVEKSSKVGDLTHFFKQRKPTEQKPTEPKEPVGTVSTKSMGGTS